MATKKVPRTVREHFKNLPPEVLEYFKSAGSSGGKMAAAAMTPKQRMERARKAANSVSSEEGTERARKAVAARETKRKGPSRAPGSLRVFGW